MAKTTWKKLSAGDLLAIPANESRALVGQVLVPGITFYMQVLDVLVGEHITLTGKQLNARVLLIGETTDAELVREHWRLIGNTPVDSGFLKPFHVVGTPSGLVLRDFERSIVRPADPADMDKYDYEVSVSPSAFTTAVRRFLVEGPSADLGILDARRVARRCLL